MLQPKEDRVWDEAAIRELLAELDALRELDRRRQGHVPGTPAFEAASLEVDARANRVMDRFRDVGLVGPRSEDGRRENGNGARPEPPESHANLQRSTGRAHC